MYNSGQDVVGMMVKNKDGKTCQVTEVSLDRRGRGIAFIIPDDQRPDGRDDGGHGGLPDYPNAYSEGRQLP